MNKDIWQNQLEFNKQFFSDLNLNVESLTIDQKSKWAKEFFVHLSRELNDLMSCLPFQKHFDTDRKLIQSNVEEEFVDALKYLMGLGQILGVSFDDVIRAYTDKSLVVEQRYAQQKSIERLRQNSVVMFDIDGVLNTYPECFIYWVNNHANVNCETHEDLKTVLGLDRYLQEKEAYRLSGAKRFQPVVRDSINAIDCVIEELDYSVILYTTRPVRRYSRIYSDTLFWLNENRIRFDAIFWSDLGKDDVSSLGLKIKFAVEDDAANALSFNQSGIRVYLLDKAYNENYSHPLTTRVKSAIEICELEKSR